MKFCERHWEQMRELINGEEKLANMVSDGAEEITQKMLQEHDQGRATLETYDPLMAMHWGILNIVVERVGLDIFQMDGPEDNEGHWCPVCYVTEYCPCSHTNCGEPYIPWAFENVKMDVAVLRAENN